MKNKIEQDFDDVDWGRVEIGLQNQEVLFTEEQQLVVDRLVEDCRVKVIEIGMELFVEDKSRIRDKIELLENIGVETIPLENVKHIIFDGETEEHSCGFKVE